MQYYINNDYSFELLMAYSLLMIVNFCGNGLNILANHKGGSLNQWQISYLGHIFSAYT